MVSSPNRTGSRRGFSLIELLVVILIIGVLVGLLLPAISGIRVKGDIAVAQNDISQISVAIESWRQSNAAKYLIDGIVMNGSATANTNLAWLKTVWTRLDVGAEPTNPSAIPLFATSLPASANGALNGNQCLVFFLGGPYYFRSLAPYSEYNSYLPKADAYSLDRIGAGLPPSSSDPFFARFPRMHKNDGTAAPLPPTFQKAFFDFPTNRINANAEFLDPWGTPYLYFVSRGSTGYLANYRQGADYTAVFSTANPIGSDIGVQAYYETTAKPANANTFQIISAGPDKKFGPGGTRWTPEREWYVEGTTKSPVDGSPQENGFDDLSNFSGGKQLGVK